MARYVLSFRVPSDYAPHAGTPAEWRAWFSGLGSALVDVGHAVTDYASLGGRRQRLPDGRLLGGVRRGHGLRAGAGQGLPGDAGRRRGRDRPRDGSRRVVSAAMTASTAPPEGSFLATGRGKVTLALLCLVTSLDVMDGAIVNVAMPTIRSHLGFSVQNLQWVISGYLITYGGFLLLGGRAGDLLGRRRLLIAGTSLFAVSSLACGVA